jgi:hypothetical protein
MVALSSRLFKEQLETTPAGGRAQAPSADFLTPIGLDAGSGVDETPDFGGEWRSGTFD